MTVDVYLCPVPVYVNPADPRLRVNGPGACGGPVVFVPFTRQAMLAIRMWPTGDVEVTPRRVVQIAGVIPPPVATGFYFMMLD